MANSLSKEVIIQKVARIERCLVRIRDEYQRTDLPFLENFSAQDAAILNMQRACEQVFDITNYIVRVKGWGSPSSRSEAIDALIVHSAISKELGALLKKMVGFRNLAIHEYQKIDMAVLTTIIEERLIDFEEFNRSVLDLCQTNHSNE
ncbi:MAG: DUF86 domain-containing protein [Bacteroidota bacterium]